MDRPVLARYEVLGELGQGGMGIVYKARQTRLGRIVALKMLHAGAHAYPAQLARFRAEAVAVARLQHPNIVQIYETGDYDGRPFFSMELVDGTSLKEKLADTPQAAGPAAALIETLARAMHAAHQQGIIHRDLKPANILLQGGPGTPLDQCTPKITDFGLAKRLDDASQTRSGDVMGTPNYMAPEQAEGRVKEVGPAADVYALCAILYEMLTGRPPFQGPTALDTLDLVRWAEPVPPRRLQPKVPRDLETICLKCLDKEPGRRYASALELAEDLRRFRADEPIRARPASARERFAKWVRRRPAVAALYGVMGAALLALGLLILWHSHDVRQQRDEAREGERLAQLARWEAEEGKRLAELRARAQERLAQGRSAVDRKDWETARVQLAGVGEQLRDDPALADLHTEAERLHQELDSYQRARADYRKFVQRRDQALLCETIFTGLDTAANLRQTREAAQEALALFAVTPDGQHGSSAAHSGSGPVIPDQYFTAGERDEIREGCYQLLLVWASTVAHSQPDQKPADQARQALPILERAAELRLATRAYRLRRARYLAQCGDLVGAEGEQRRAQATPPTGALDYFLLGEDHYRHGALEEAVRDFHRALLTQPAPCHFWARYFLAAGYLNLAEPRPDLARATLDACLIQRRDIPWVYLLRGFAQSELRDFEAAEADFQEAQKYDLDATAAYGLHVNRGVLRLREAVAAEAVAGLRYAAALLPNAVACQACEQLAQLRQQQKLAAAVDDLQYAIRLKPDQYQAYVNLAQVYQHQKNWDGAVQQLTRATGLEPTQAFLYRERATVRLRQGDSEEALADLERAIAREPAGSSSQADDRVQQGHILLFAGQAAKAVAAYDAALAIRPDYAQAHRGRVEALLKLERYREAVRALDQYEPKARPSAWLYRTRGLARAKLGNEKEAVDDYTRALLLTPDAATYVLRGWAYLLGFGSPRQALADFEEAIRLDPHNAEAYSGRGNSRVQIGWHVENALADAEQALRLAPRSPRVQYGAARIFAQVAGSIDGQASPTAGELERRATCQDRAVVHLRQATVLYPTAQRRSFWRDRVATDSAFKPIRSSPDFLYLAAEYARSGPAK
jgi:tetratricopeptide (TPR) repeat protein